MKMPTFWKSCSLRVQDSEILVVTACEKYLHQEFISSHLVRTVKDFLYEVQNCDIFSMKFVQTFYVTHNVHILTINPLAPNDNYSGRTAPITSKRCILYIYSTNIGTEYFKHGI